MMENESAAADDLDARVAHLYQRVSSGVPPPRVTIVWVRFEVRADSDDEAIRLVRDQIRTGYGVGVNLLVARVGTPRWDDDRVAGEAGC